MATGPRYSVKFRRRREGKTDYKTRISYLKSSKPRVVIRKTNSLIIAQIVKYSEKGDISLKSINSSSLKKFGWKGSIKNIPAAYLTGLLLGKNVKLKEFILDIGQIYSRKGIKIYAVAKGFKDAGNNLAFDDQMSPSQDRIEGKHLGSEIQKNFENVKKKIQSKK